MSEDDDVIPRAMAQIEHPESLEEAFDGGQFWDVVSDRPSSAQAEIALLRVALLLCRKTFDASIFRRLSTFELHEEAERYGRRCEGKSVLARGE